MITSSSSLLSPPPLQQEAHTRAAHSPSVLQVQYTIEVLPTASLSQVSVSSLISTPYHHYKRDTTSSSSSTSSSSASKTTHDSDKCTGSKQECQKPTERNMGMVVGIATAIPVFVIIVIFSVLFYIIYRRSKKEALEDDFDPEFDGDAEFLPTNYVQMRPNPNSSSSAETTSQDMKEKFEQNFYASRGLGGGGMQMPAATPMAMAMQRGYSSNTLNTRSSLNPFGNSVATAGLTDQAWEMDAIRLPEGNDSESLKNFARKLQTESVGGYHVASSSRNASQLSLGVATHEQTRNLCGPDSMVKRNTLEILNSSSGVVDNNNKNDNNNSEGIGNVDRSDAILHEADVSFAGTTSNLPLLGGDREHLQQTARPTSQFGNLGPNDTEHHYYTSNKQDRTNDVDDADNVDDSEGEFEFEVSNDQVRPTYEQNASSTTPPDLIHDTALVSKTHNVDASLAEDDPDSKVYSLKKIKPLSTRGDSLRKENGNDDDGADEEEEHANDSEESEEEENIKRMRSIYNVYMDGTLETSSSLAKERESGMSHIAPQNSASGPGGVASPSYHSSPLAIASINQSPQSHISGRQGTITRLTSDRRSSRLPMMMVAGSNTDSTGGENGGSGNTPSREPDRNSGISGRVIDVQNNGDDGSTSASNGNNLSPSQGRKLDSKGATGTSVPSNEMTSVVSSEGNSGSSHLSVTQQKKMSRGSSYRPPSSVYSEAPGPAYFQQQNYQQHQLPQGYNMQQLQAQWGRNPQGQYYRQDYLPQEYYMQSIPYQHGHPQTLEEIGELPTPAKLVNSSSLHSLTSFKGPSKPQYGQQLQPASINGTALNPMDHPEMFYLSNTEPSFAQEQQTRNSDSTSSLSKNGSSTSALLPFQLRTSVVMTNPAEVESNNSYKPAGSLRKFNDTNGRNNSFTTQTNPYQQMLESRVSGILQPTDVIQPASMGSILPHSGSQEDLRKQLGTSDKYKII